MADMDIVVKDVTGNKQETVQLPDNVPVNRIIVLLVDRLKYPRFDATGGQTLIYKLRHLATNTQLQDQRTLKEAGVKPDDVLQLLIDVIAGKNLKPKIHGFNC